MLNNLREVLQPLLEKIGKAFASTGIPPNVWTAVALILSFIAAISYASNNNLEFAFIIGGIILLISGFFDVVDGQVARVTKKTSKKGSFLDSVFDKIAEVSIFLGILVSGAVEPYLVLLAITLSLLVSYTRSKADALGIKLQGIGIGERAERLLVIAIIGMIPGLMMWAVIIVVIISAITLIQRIIVTTKNLHEDLS